MKPAVAVALICALSAPSLSAAQANDIQWSNVLELAPGARLALSARGGPSHRALLLFADDTELKALNLSGLDLPVGATRELRRLASEEPHQLLSVTPERSLLIDKAVTLRAAGLFDGVRKLANYEQVIESISRRDVQTGVVRLENVSAKEKMSAGTKVLIGIGITLAVPFVIYFVACAVQGCD